MTISEYHGDLAVEKVSELLGRPLDHIEERVVRVEGYVDGVYRDSKGVATAGVGQTGVWIDLGFEAALQHHIDRARRRVNNFDCLPPDLQAELVQSEYRGDLGLSPKAMSHFNNGYYVKAAIEFLDHAEFRDPKVSTGVKARLLATAAAIYRYHEKYNS